jgi:hypothetical protein
MLTAQTPVPEHPPLQPVKVDPLSGVAVKTTDALELNVAEQIEPQLIPEGALVTVPLPTPDLVTVSVYCVIPVWVMVKSCPAMVIVPVRGVVPVFVETAYPIVPLPIPEAPDITIIQGALLVADHVQVPNEAVTLTLPLPPLSMNELAVGDMPSVHGANVAVTAAFVFMAIEQDPVPEHAAPLQPESADPLSGIAVKVTDVPAL